MSRCIDLTGNKYERLTVLRRDFSRTGKDAYWICKCECGNITSVAARSLKSKNTMSCGCLNNDLKKNNKRSVTHNKSCTRLYQIYSAMKSRCYYRKNASYNYYGKRGIKVCDEWLNSFTVFYNWAIKNGYSNNLSIDRIDVNGNYEPNNCKWATNKEQQNNKTNSKFITYKGMTMTVSEWAEMLNINKNTLAIRLYRGWDIEKALEI